MRIAHVIDSGGYYGAEAVLLELMREQSGRGLLPELISIGNRRARGDKAVERAAAARGLPVFKVRFRDGPNPAGGLKILRYANRHCDMLHCHGYKPDILLGMLPSALRRVPLVSTVHGWTGGRGWSRIGLYNWLDKKALKRMDGVVFVNDVMKAGFGGGDDHRPLRATIYNGISQPDDSASPPQDDPVVAFCARGPVIGAVGRLAEEKAFPDLIEALKWMRDAGTDVRLVILGDGPLKADLQSRIERGGLDEHVLMAGYRENAAAYMGLFDVFVISSISEGLPVTLLEAMACRVPVVATSVGGIPDVLDGGSGGRLAPAGDTPALAAALSGVLEDRESAAERSEHAYRKFCADYSAAAMEQRYREFYKSVCNRRAVEQNKPS